MDDDDFTYSPPAGYPLIPPADPEPGVQDLAFPASLQPGVYDGSTIGNPAIPTAGSIFDAAGAQYQDQQTLGNVGIPATPTPTPDPDDIYFAPEATPTPSPTPDDDSSFSGPTMLAGTDSGSDDSSGDDGN